MARIKHSSKRLISNVSMKRNNSDIGQKRGVDAHALFSVRTCSYGSKGRVFYSLRRIAAIKPLTGESAQALVTAQRTETETQLDFKNRSNLRTWWHNIIATHGKFNSYAFFLVLPSNKAAINYLSEFGQELEILSGDKCLIIILTDTTIASAGSGHTLCDIEVQDYVSSGYSVRIADHYRIKPKKLPCMVLFADIRSSDHVFIPLKGLGTEEIAEKMQNIFSAIHEATLENQDLFEAVQSEVLRDMILRIGGALKQKVGKFADKTFESAIEALVRANIMPTP